MATQGSLREEVEASKPSKECHFWSLSIVASKPSPDSRREDIGNAGAACTTVWGRLVWGHLGRFGGGLREGTNGGPACARPVPSKYLKNIPANASQLSRSRSTCPSWHARPPIARYKPPTQVDLM